MHGTGNQPIAMQDFQIKDLKSGFSSDLWNHINTSKAGEKKPTPVL